MVATVTPPADGPQPAPPPGATPPWWSHRRLQWLLPAVGWLILIAVWQLTVLVNQLPAVVLPGPDRVVDSLRRLARSSSFYEHLGTSLAEFATGFAIGVVAGVTVGLLLSELPSLRMTAQPILETLRFVVPFAWIPLTIIWFGTGMWGKTWLVAYAVFFVMVVSTMDSVLGLDRTLTRVATMLGMNRWRRAVSVHLRAAAPSVASAGRAAAAIGWIAVVAAEYVGASSGLGFMIIDARSSLNTAVVIAGMVVIGAIGAALSYGIGWMSRRWFHY